MTAAGTTFVWDASALHHPAKAGRIDVLGTFVRGPENARWTHYVTDVVADELNRYGLDVPTWAELVTLDSLDLVLSYASWSSVLSDGVYGHGEASVAAWAGTCGDVAIIDDGAARLVTARYGLKVHGSAWLLCQAINAGLLDATSASTFYEASRDSGAWLPFPRFGFRSWATAKGLLGPQQA